MAQTISWAICYIWVIWALRARFKKSRRRRCLKERLKRALCRVLGLCGAAGQCLQLPVRVTLLRWGQGSAANVPSLCEAAVSSAGFVDSEQRRVP